MKLKGNEIGFWQGVYIAAIKRGHTSGDSSVVADRAVASLRLRLETEEVDKEKGPYR